MKYVVLYETYDNKGKHYDVGDTVDIKGELPPLMVGKVAIAKGKPKAEKKGKLETMK